MRLAPVLAVLGCATKPTPVAEPVAVPPPVVAPGPAAPAPTVAPLAASAPVAVDDGPYGGAIRSVRFLRTTTLLKEPRHDAVKVGIIRKDTRARALREAPPGAGCDERWIQIAPRGWTCESALDPSFEEPTTAAAPSLTEPEGANLGPLVPGVYGIVRGTNVQAYETRGEVQAGEGRTLEGKHSVRAAGVVVVDGVRYWRTSMGDLIEASSIVQIAPSRFKGIEVDGELPAWVRARGNPYKAAKTFAAPRGKPNGSLAPRTIVSILEESEDGAFARVSDTAWIARADLRVASLAAPPPGAGPDEKWFDIDLDEQVLVAYEGTRPVYATLVSTGKWKHETPAAIARVASKLERAHMVSEKDDPYSVSDVPWTMYYDRNYALHTSYWHDGFGGPRSHGCINLAPRDARLLFRWSSPDVPPGWIAVYGDEDNPGSLVRVRSRRVPEPAYRGYARTLHERSVMISSVTPSG